MLVENKKKILFIEDAKEFQEQIEGFFEAEGYEVVSAYDGEAGLQLAEKIIPDIILLDLILPKKNGLDVLKELKNNPRLEKVPVVILTNLEGTQDIEQALSLGASMYLVKANYSLENILGKVEEVFRNNQKEK